MPFAPSSSRPPGHTARGKRRGDPEQPYGLWIARPQGAQGGCGVRGRYRDGAGALPLRPSARGPGAQTRVPGGLPRSFEGTRPRRRHQSNVQGPSSLFAVRRDKRQFGKIRAIAPRVAREQGCGGHAGVRSDEEVRQRGGPHSAGAPIQSESLRGAEGSGFGYFGERQIELLDLRVTIRLRFKPNRKLRVDDRVDQQWAAGMGGDDRMTRPIRPWAIAGRDVDQNIRVDEDQSSPRVMRMTSSVERPRIGRRRLI